MVSDLSTHQAQGTRFVGGNRYRLLPVVIAIALVCFTKEVMAASDGQREVIEFDIPQQRADVSLTLFAEQANLTLILPYELTRGVKTSELKGAYSVPVAIKLLLAGTALSPEFSDQGLLTNITDRPSVAEGDQMVTRKKGLLAGIAAIFVGAGANAQDSSEETERTLEEITVTGSLIRSRRKDFETPSPVQTIGRKEIADTGAFQVQDIFKGLTANSGSQIANRQNALQGLSQFSLRGLGIGSTLTMINGRRAGLAPITDSSGQLFTDSNQFPVNMIERVEVLTDGASSTYGSEAVAGVVNIYTRDSFEGFELTAEGRTASNDSFSVGGAFGVQGDRGGVALFATYYEQDGNVRGDFDFIANGNTLGAGTASLFDSVTGSPGRISVAVVDATAPGGFTRGASTLADPDCVAAGGFIDGANCRYNFLNQVRLIAEETRFQAFSTMNYDVTDELNIFTELGFSRNEVRDGIGGTLTRRTVVGGGFLVPDSHPFNFFVTDGAGGISYAGPAAFTADPTLQAVPVIFRGRPLGADSDGDNLTDIETVFTNLRFAGGFNYGIGDNWFLNGSYVWSNSDYNRAQPHDWDIAAYQGQILAGAWNPFGTRVSEPTLVSPRDGVSVAGNSSSVFNQFALIRNDSAEVTQTVAEVILSGETGLSMPGGNLALAVGAQYRNLELEDIPDGRYQSGNNRLNELIPATFGEQDAIAYFGEVVLPVTERFEVQGAVRFEDFDDQGGDTTDPKIAAKFDLTDNLSLRASWGTSFQAPSIRQVAGVISSATINDPADPGSGAFIITVITGGSPILTPQSAENLNFGVIFRSEFGLDLSVDYWTYDYEDLILPGADPQFIFDEVFAGRLPPDRATRDAVGQPATAVAEFQNRGKATASGFDFVGRYETEAGSGNLTFDLTSTIITEYDSTEFGDILGSRNFSNGFGSTPDLKINGAVTYERGAHVVNLTARHIGSYTDDQTNNAVDSQITLDARYQLFLDGLLGGEGSISVGVINLLDEDPPLLTARPLFDTEVHDPRGRQIYVAFKQNF